MFFTYVARELRRRRRQAMVVALGLALGVGLVVTVSAMAAGVRSAQGSVLQSLYGVGTDITVTRPARPGTGGPARFGLNAPSEEQRGKRFSRDDILQSAGLSIMAASGVDRVAGLTGVKAAAGALSLTSIHAEGEFPDEVGVGQAPAPGSEPVAV
ncbi:MAG: ABC transporter permease, partial [Actinomycetota bacterium]